MPNLLNRIANPEKTFERIMQDISQPGIELIDLNPFCELVLERISQTYDVSHAGLFLKQKAAGRYHLGARVNLAIGDMQFGLQHPLPFYLDRNPRALHAGDIEVLPQFEALWEKERADLEQLNASLYLPLKAGGDLVGILMLGSKTHRNHFRPEEEEELLTVASQVAMAIRLKYLNTSELRLKEEAQSMRQALSEITSGRDAEESLNRTLEHLKSALPYESGCILVMQNERLVVAAVHGFNNPEKLIGRDYPLNGNTPFETLRDTRDTLLVENTHEDPQFNGYAGPAVLKSWLGIPLSFSGEFIGALAISSQKEGAFHANPARLDLVHALANQAAITIENSRLFQSEQKQRQMADALYHLGIEVSQISDFNQKLDFLLEQASQVIPADIAMFFQAEGGQFQLTRHHYSEQLAARVDLTVDSPAFEAAAFANLHYLVKTDQPHIIPDTRKEQEWVTSPVEVRSWAGTPIYMNGKAIACLTFSSLKPHFYQPETAELLTILAGQVALAFQNIQLISEVRELAIRDEMTGLFNSRHFLDLGEREFRRARRFRRPLSVMRINIDQLDQIRENHGSDIVNQVMRYVAELIQTNLRNVDILGHLNHHDLGIILTETDRGGASILSDRLLTIVTSSPVITTAGLVKISFSAGVAVLTNEVADLDNLLKRTAEALETAQQNGRNRVVFY